MQWRAGDGVVVASTRLGFFFIFCIFLCRAYFWVTHDKERVTLSPRRRPSTLSLCRASHIAYDKELCRALPFPKAHDKGLYQAKMRRVPFAMRLSKIRMEAVSCGFWPLPCVLGAWQRPRFL
jgi:hypothetical protein